MKFFKKKPVNPEVVELEHSDEEFMKKRYLWLEAVTPEDEIHNSYKWTVVCLLKDIAKRLKELEK